MRQTWKKLNGTNLSILVMGGSVSKELQDQVLRALDLGAEVTGSPRAYDQIGAPMISFGKHETSSLPYPASGLPSVIVDRISASTEEQVAGLFSVTGKKPFNIVIAEITTKDVSTSPTSMIEVRGQIHYNTDNALSRTTAAGKISFTSAKQLEQLLDLIEGGTDVTEEVYDSIATWSSVATMRMLRKRSRAITEGASLMMDEAKAALTEIGYFTAKVKDAEEVQA